MNLFTKRRLTGVENTLTVTKGEGGGGERHIRSLGKKSPPGDSFTPNQQ